MRYNEYAKVLLFIIFSSSGFLPDNAQQSSKSLDSWIKALKQNPNDITALEGLGEACCASGRFDTAVKVFEKVLRQNPSYARAVFYLGQVLEKQGQKTRALEIYSRFKNLEKGDFRDNSEERYIILKRQLTIEDVKKIFKQEQSIGSGKISDQAVAVLPFSVPKGESAYESLGKGIAEMVITDLSQIHSLKPVERIRTQALLDEMELGQTGMIESSGMARFGRFLSAGRVVKGELSVGEDKKVRIDATTLDAIRNKTASPVQVADNFDRLFRVEKNLVFKILGQMAIDPTPQERQRIMRVPTQNLQAFIAYCNGLDLEDRGAFSKAAVQYQKAIDLDPEYTQAREKMKISNVLAKSDEDMRQSVLNSEASNFSQETLILQRLNMGRANLGSNFYLGKDVRKPIQELWGPEIPDQEGYLPRPPAPPQPVP